MKEQEIEALRLARECLVFIVHGYVNELTEVSGNYSFHGLCTMMRDWILYRSRDVYQYYNECPLQLWMIEWPESTKSARYPVPCPRNAMSCSSTEEERAFDIYHTHNSGKYKGEYGELRLDLARFLIGKIDEVLANETLS